MESSSGVKRSTQVFTLQPNETVLTALPYGPHSSLLDFLKGEPKVLGALQILLALIIAGVGAIFAFNYFNFTQRFPLVFFTGYPFWGALVFIITGCITGSSKNDKCLGQDATGMSIISSMVAVAGITLTVISYRQQHMYCQAPSLEGICVIGRVLYNGILSVLLISSIAQLSISVTVASFRSKCWTRSNEIVFFLPSDVTQDSELSVPEENAVIQFEHQEESTSDVSTTNIQPVFFGGYTFFKLRVTRHPSAFQHSVSVADEQQKYSPPPLSLYEEDLELESLPLSLELRPSEIMHTNELNDEDLRIAIIQSPEKKTQLLHARPLQLQALPPYAEKDYQALQPQVLPSQPLPAKAQPSEAPTSHVTESHGLTSQDMQPQHKPSENTQSVDTLSQCRLGPDTPSQNTFFQRRVLPVNAMPFEVPTIRIVEPLNTQHRDQQSLDFQLQNIQSQDHQSIRLSYQDIKSEVKLLTEEWKSEEELHRRKSSKQHSLYQQNEDWQPLKEKPLDLKIQAQQSPRRKSLDKHIKIWLSQKKQYKDKQVQVNETTLQLLDEQVDDQKGKEEKPPKQLYQDQQSQIQEYHGWQAQDQKIQGWQSLGQQSQDYRTLEWKNNEWKAQERQLEMQHSLNWESQARQTQDLLLKKSLKQKALFQETQPLYAVIPPHLDGQVQDVPYQDSQHQDKDQEDLQPTRTRKEDMERDAVQTRDINPEDVNCGSKSPSDVQSEDMKPDFNCSSYQSSAQGTDFTYLSNLNSEQDVQQNTSVCSTASKDLTLTPTSSYPNERQQSEDSD
ncbi:membrane-spanning 4-domains subfamily A member 14 [Camelus bactrianus]|uniref:Membrane-spanning 4-domains subfamily A member 14 n=1 Tax=Camelus bactrianus TaxID=9837 RepID=A0A9W3ES38_CAMBA